VAGGRPAGVAGGRLASLSGRPASLSGRPASLSGRLVGLSGGPAGRTLNWAGSWRDNSGLQGKGEQPKLDKSEFSPDVLSSPDVSSSTVGEADDGNCSTGCGAEN
jgi:hypothetical protein